MATYSLPRLLQSLHESVEQELRRVRATFHHPGTKGDASESVWIGVLNDYLPKRYQAARAHVVDSDGGVSHQIDLVVFDRQYSPFIFKYDQHSYIPAESVYAVFEAKQEVTANIVEYAHQKIASVRTLNRKCVAIPGEPAPRKPVAILGGLLSLESKWTPPLGPAFRNALLTNVDSGRIDLGCVASHGNLFFDATNTTYVVDSAPRAATTFIFRLITKLQSLGTVPMVDLDAYAKALAIVPPAAKSKAPSKKATQITPKKTPAKKPKGQV